VSGVSDCSVRSAATRLTHPGLAGFSTSFDDTPMAWRPTDADRRSELFDRGLTKPFAALAVGRTDRKQIVNRRRVVRRCRGHHRLVCLARIDMRRYDKQKNSLAADAEHPEGVGRLPLVSIESNRSAARLKSSRHLCPLGEVVRHAINGAKAH
jgi:hypothetical protein